MSNASMSEEEECHVFGPGESKRVKLNYHDLRCMRGIYGVVKVLAKLADTISAETQDLNDDLLCIVLERAEEQIWGLVLAQEGNRVGKLDTGPMRTRRPSNRS